MLFNQADILNPHRFLGGFRHIVDRERGNRDGGQRFHLGARFADSFHRGGDDYAGQRFVQREIYSHVLERERMAKRNQVRGSF